MPTLSIVNTPGASTANSYVSLAEADGYLFAHPDWERWDAKSTDEKQRILIKATRDIDKLYLSGVKKDTGIGTGGTPNQALHFPRSQDVYNSAGYIPNAVKVACYTQALYMVQMGMDIPSHRRLLQMQGVTDISIAGDISETYDLGKTRPFSPDAMKILMQNGMIEVGAQWE